MHVLLNKPPLSKLSHRRVSHEAERVTPEFLIGSNKTANLPFFSPSSPGSFIVMQFCPWGASHFVMIQCAKFIGKWFTVVLSKLWRVRTKGLVGMGWAWARLHDYVSVPPPRRRTYECKKQFFFLLSPVLLYPCNNHAALVLCFMTHVCRLLRKNPLSWDSHCVWLFLMLQKTLGNNSAYLMSSFTKGLQSYYNQKVS